MIIFFSFFIPENKRGSYSALSNLSYIGAELIARSSIILGAYLKPSMMSITIGLVVMIGIIFVYTSLFAKSLKINRFVTKKTNLELNE